MATGSLWPGVLAHFANNVHGVAWVLLFGPEDETHIPAGVALLCLLAAAAAAITTLRARRDSPPPA